MNKKLMRSRENRVIFGVCGGLAEYFGIDASIVRVVTAVLALVTSSVFFWVYLVLGLALPEGGRAPQTGRTAQQRQHPAEPREEWQHDAFDKCSATDVQYTDVSRYSEEEFYKESQRHDHE